MPRPKAPTITAVTDDLLAERWDNENACRMWLRRRRTSAQALGLVIATIGTEVALRRPTAAAPLHSDVAAIPPVPDDFEDFAAAVDELLQAADEDPEKDAVLRALLRLGATAESAASLILMLRRSARELRE